MNRDAAWFCHSLGADVEIFFRHSVSSSAPWGIEIRDKDHRLTLHFPDWMGIVGFCSALQKEIRIWTEAIQGAAEQIREMEERKDG